MALFLNKIVKEGPLGRYFKGRPTGEGGRHAEIWDKSTTGGGSSKCKGPEAGAGLTVCKAGAV